MPGCPPPRQGANSARCSAEQIANERRRRGSFRGVDGILVPGAASENAASRARSSRSASPGRTRVPFLGHLLRHAGGGGRVCSQSSAGVDRRDDRRSTTEEAGRPGDQPHGRAEEASKNLGGTMRLGAPSTAGSRPDPSVTRRLRHRPSSCRAAPAPLRVQQCLPRLACEEAGLVLAGINERTRPGGDRRVSRITPGSSACSSTPSSRRDRSNHTRCSGTSSAPVFASTRSRSAASRGRPREFGSRLRPDPSWTACPSRILAPASFRLY